MKRDGSKEKFWREAIAEAGRSGKSTREFCRQRGLKEALFYSWRRELKRRETQGGKQDGFVELVRPAGRAAEAGVSIRVDDRVRIVLDRGFDDAALKAALTAVLGAGGQ